MPRHHPRRHRHVGRPGRARRRRQCGPATHKEHHGPSHTTAQRARRRPDRRHRHHHGDAGLVPGVRLLGHLLARPARRPRRPQAGAASDPLHDERDGPAARPRSRQERPRRRRGHGQAAPARRCGHLRRPGPNGPVVLPAHAAGRRPRQLRLPRRRAGRLPLHRVPHGPGSPPDGRRPRRGGRRLRAQLRRARAGTGRPAGCLPEPAGQRRLGHRGGDGHQHGPAQPRRGDRGSPASARPSGGHHRRPHALRPRAGPAHRRPDRGPRRRSRRVPHRVVGPSGCARRPRSSRSPPAGPGW